MNIVFKNIEINNFMSFSNCSLKLDDNGFVRVIGENQNKLDGSTSNGSGKSAIWEALSWCLTGSTLRGSKDVVRHGAEACCVTLSFLVDSDAYAITREKYASKSNLVITKNQEDISGKGIRDSEIILSQHLPDLNESLINSIIVLGQGLPMRFTNNTPSGRKEVLEKLSRSDFMIEDLKNRVADRKTELNDHIKDYCERITKVQTEQELYKSDLSKKVDKLNELKAVDFSQLNKEKEDLETREKYIDSEIYNIIHYYGCSIDEKIDSLTDEKMDEVSRHQSSINQCNSKFNSASLETSQKIAELKSTISYKSAEIQKLNSISDICPTCGQKLPEVHKVDTSSMVKDLENDKKAFDNETIKLNEYKKILEEDIKEENDKHNKNFESIVEEIATAKDLKNKLSDYTIEENKILSRIEEINKIISTNNDSIIEYSEYVKDLEDKINNLVKKEAELTNENCNYTTRLGIQSQFDTALKRDFRGILLQNCISYIDSKAKEYSKKIFGTDLIKFELDGNNISITYNSKEYESMSGGEKKKVDIIIQFAIRDMLCKYLGFSCNILILDEIFDELDAVGCNKVIDFINDNLTDISSVYIISHRHDLAIPNDSELHIVKNSEGISSVI